MEFHAISLGKHPEDVELSKILPKDRVFESKVEALVHLKKWKTCEPILEKPFKTEEEALNCAKTIRPPKEIVPQENQGPGEGCPFKGLIGNFFYSNSFMFIISLFEIDSVSCTLFFNIF